MSATVTATSYRGFRPTGLASEPLSDRIRRYVDAWHHWGGPSDSMGRDAMTKLTASGWFPEIDLKPEGGPCLAEDYCEAPEHKVDDGRRSCSRPTFRGWSCTDPVAFRAFVSEATESVDPDFAMEVDGWIGCWHWGAYEGRDPELTAEALHALQRAGWSRHESTVPSGQHNQPFGDECLAERCDTCGARNPSDSHRDGGKVVGKWCRACADAAREKRKAEQDAKRAEKPRKSPRLTKRWIADASMPQLEERKRSELAKRTSAGSRSANRIEAEIQRRHLAKANQRKEQDAAATDKPVPGCEPESPTGLAPARGGEGATPDAATRPLHEASEELAPGALPESTEATREGHVDRGGLVSNQTPEAAVKAHAVEVDPGIEAYDPPDRAQPPLVGLESATQEEWDSYRSTNAGGAVLGPRVEVVRAMTGSNEVPVTIATTRESTNADSPSGTSPPPLPLSTYTDVDTAGMPPVDVPLAMFETGADEAERLRLEVERLRDVIAAEPLASVRASSMPLAMRCPASVRPMYARWQDENEAARLGSAVHEALAYVDDLAPLDEIAARWSVPGSDLRPLFFQGVKARRRLVEAFGAPALVEQALEYVRQDGTKLTGHVDLAFVAGSTLVVVDYKSGRVHGDYEDQLRTYGAAAASWLALDGVEVDRVAAYVVWLRDANDDGEPTIVREGVWSVEELFGWAEADTDHVFRWDGNYHAGEHCGYCPLRNACPAHDEQQRAVVRWALDQPGAPAAGYLEDGELVELRHRAKRLGRIAADADKATREVVQLRGEVGPFKAVETSRKAYLVEAVLDAVSARFIGGPYDLSGPTVTSGVVDKIAEVEEQDPANVWRLIKAAGGEVRTNHTQIRETKPRRGKEAGR